MVQTPPFTPPLTAQQKNARAAAAAAVDSQAQQTGSLTLQPRGQMGARQLNSLAGPLTRAISMLDQALVTALSRPCTADGRSLMRLEALCLLENRLALASYVRRDGPQSQERVDAIVAESLIEACEEAQILVAELQVSGLARLERLWSTCRSLATQLTALGGDAKLHREAIAEARRRLTKTPGTLAAAEAEAATLFVPLAKALLDVRKSGPLSALDGLLYGG